MAITTRRNTWICGFGSAALVLTSTLICSGNVDQTSIPKPRVQIPVSFTAEGLGNATFVCGMNDNGDVTGSVDNRETGSSRAFLWSHGKMIDIGGSPGRILRTGLAINDQGQILCNAVRSERDWYSSFPALYENGTATDLRNVPGGKHIVEAYHIDRHGHIVGRNENGDTLLFANGHWQKFAVPNGWVPNARWNGRDQWVSNYDRIVINNNGDTAGIFRHGKGKEGLEAVVQGTTYPISALPGALGTELKGMSDTGIVAGNSHLHPIITSFFGDSSPADGAFMWTAAGGTQALPAVDGGSWASVSAISSNGDIVGTSRDTTDKLWLTLWRDGKAIAIRNLPPALISAQNIKPVDVNDKDQICVRTGEGMIPPHMDEPIYYLLTPQSAPIEEAAQPHN